VTKTTSKDTSVVEPAEQDSPGSDASRPAVETVRVENTFGSASEWHKTVVLARIEGHRGIVQHRRRVRITSGAAPAKTSLDPDVTFRDLNEFGQELLMGKAPEVDEWL
jgi:hypothetical protein